MYPAPDLSVVIPVHNDAETIGDLVASFRSLPTITTEVVLVDDCSSDNSAEVLAALATEDDRVKIRSHRLNRGAGVARNTGFADAAGRYTIFFDADDLLHPDAVETAVPLLDETGASVALLAYHYRRRDRQHTDMNEGDVAIFDAYLGRQHHRVGTLHELPRLLTLTAYPWNRILRTSVYRDAGIRFGSTAVHNDILGHWYSLLFAKRVLLINEAICTHIVSAGGKNLTNRGAVARIHLFDALDEAYSLLESHPHLRKRYAHFYWSTVIEVSKWARSRITSEYLSEFNLRFEQHIQRVDLSDFARIRTHRNPALGKAMVHGLFG